MDVKQIFLQGDAEKKKIQQKPQNYIKWGVLSEDLKISVEHK